MQTPAGKKTNTKTISQGPHIRPVGIWRAFPRGAEGADLHCTSRPPAPFFQLPERAYGCAWRPSPIARAWNRQHPPSPERGTGSCRRREGRHKSRAASCGVEAAVKARAGPLVGVWGVSQHGDTPHGCVPLNITSKRIPSKTHSKTRPNGPTV